MKADTGELVWQERVAGNFSASPVSAKGRLYLLSDEGVTTVIAAGPEFEVLAKICSTRKFRLRIGRFKSPFIYSHGKKSFLPCGIFLWTGGEWRALRTDRFLEFRRDWRRSDQGRFRK